MSNKRVRGLLISAVAVAVASMTGMSSAAAQSAGPVTMQGDKCRTVYAKSGKGYADVCWTWHADSHGTYYGSYWGSFYDTAPSDRQWVVLQATWNGAGRWVPVKSAANGEDFRDEYSGLRGLTFRACTNQGYCGSAAAP
ncbi:hypothetical protein EAO75_09170 [Streptomyces sp. uw30]|uniref:hypothetical protein n=1 Tax=Streptomyces sp. uw30 TaxID=1828179 RepID=UPI0011CD495C|nr:hypothetical protein [Streptomyces sp. uw30]TXS52094.1 hypothetical protein EAO75_09170 [Streptomyces sp. uw30]